MYTSGEVTNNLKMEELPYENICYSFVDSYALNLTLISCFAGSVLILVTFMLV